MELRPFIAGVLCHEQAEPILITPPTRREFAKNGLIDRDEANVPYADATRAVAEELKIPLVDLNVLTRDLFDRLGKDSSNWMQPEGDNTHFTKRGAQCVAARVVESLQSVVPELEPFVIQDELAHY